MTESGYIPGSDFRDKRDPSMPKYEAGSATVKGEPTENHPKEVNEDRAITRPDIGLVAAIDGAGGHADGDKAAGIAADILERTIETYLHHEGTTPEILVKHALTVADEEVNKYNQREGSNSMAAAALALCYEKDGQRYAAVASVGDARVYVLSVDGKLRCVTTDNVDDATEYEVVTQMKRDQDRNDEFTKKETDEEKSYFGYRHVVQYAVGNAGGNPRVITVALMPGDTIITTTDGIHDVLTKTQLEQVAAGHNRGRNKAQSIAEAILARTKTEAVNAGNKRKKNDDRTVVILAPTYQQADRPEPTTANPIITEVPSFDTETRALHPEKGAGKYEVRLDRNGNESIPAVRLKGPVEIRLKYTSDDPALCFEVHYRKDDHKIIILQNGHKPIEYATGKGVEERDEGVAIAIGRQLSILFPEKFSAINDPNVSRNHVGILYEDGDIIISDLNTTNHSTLLTYELK